MTVKIFKLTTGEEIIAEVTQETETHVSLDNPLAIMLRPSQDGFTYGFVPWCHMIDGAKQIPLNSIVVSGPASDDVKNTYNSMFGGIVTPPKNLIV
jgi:hypothetical protein